MEYMIEAPQEIPVVGSYDVIVIGGGPAGVSAAIASARAGAKTAIIERYGYFGGQATGGLVILIVGLTEVGKADSSQKVIEGICSETINRLQAMKATREIGVNVLFDPEAMKYIFDQMIMENDIKPYFHSFVSGAVSAKGKMTAVILESKSGRIALKSKVFVDATGDADLARLCGVPFDMEIHDNLMPVTLGFRVGGLNIEKVFNTIVHHNDFYKALLEDLGINTRIGGWIPTIHEGEAWFNIAHVEKVNPLDVNELTLAEIKARELIFKIMEKFVVNLDGFENAYLIDTASQIGIRDTRRIKGIHRFEEADILKEFSTSIAKVPDYTHTGKGFAQVPFECLISNELDNVIFTGRSVSVEHKLLDMFREIPACMATGQAGGIAAALTAKTLDINKISIKEIQDELIKQRALIK